MVTEEDNKSTEVAASSSHWPHWLRFDRFSWLDLVVFAVAEGVAVPLCIAGGDAFVRRDWIGAAIGWGLGLPLFVFGIAFPLSKYWLRPRTIIRIQRTAINWAPVVIICALVYIVGPSIYYRFRPPPSAEEIAQSVIRLLPGQQSTVFSTNQPATSEPPTSSAAAPFTPAWLTLDRRNTFKSGALSVINAAGNLPPTKIETVAEPQTESFARALVDMFICVAFSRKISVKAIMSEPRPRTV